MPEEVPHRKVAERSEEVSCGRQRHHTTVIYCRSERNRNATRTDIVRGRRW
ncbi:hypothetical protein RSAG8_05246, partial [Rhizoctonia solani AG-8 WAC10335]